MVTGALAALFVAAGASIAQAAYSGAPIPVDFSSLSGSSSTTQIQNVFNQALAAAGFSGVTVTISGAKTSTTYTGDGHVVGKVTNGSVSSYTLKSLDGTAFLQNNSPTYSAFTITFSTALPINSLSFDYEIFPDGSCPSLSSCGTKTWNSTTGRWEYANLPSLTVTDTYLTSWNSRTHSYNTATSTVFQRYAVVPGQPLGPFYSTCPSSGQTNCGGGGSVITTTTHSPNSGATANEAAPQLLGTSGIVQLNLPAGNNGVKSLTFNDWPATIAISNLIFNPYKAPEPGSLALLVSGLAAFCVYRRRWSRPSA
jgi:hypothetical protein